MEVQGKFSGIASLETVWKCKASLVVLLHWRQSGSARQVWWYCFTGDSLEVQGKFSGISSLETVWKCKASLVVLASSRQFGSARQV